MAWIEEKKRTLADGTQDLPRHLPQDEAPVKGLKIRRGIACTNGNCDYCCTTKNSHYMHWSKHHRSKASSAADEHRDADLQFHFQSHPKYFAMEPALMGTDSDSTLYQYIKQFNKKIAESNSNGVPLDPISPTEVPPLLQETQWHTHLHRFTHSKTKLKALLRLTRLPTGKKAQHDPLGDTLRQTIVLYLRNIHKKARDSDLDVRALLIECPPG